MPYTVHSLKDDIDLLLSVRVAFRRYPGSPEEGPSYACGGVPAQGSEVEMSRVWVLDDGGVERVAPDWLAAKIAAHCSEDMEFKAQDDHDRAHEEADERRWAGRMEAAE